MSLITCPECAHEVSSTATACPNCGHTFARPVVHPKIIVNELPPEREDFPKWIFIPLGILGVVLLFVLFAWMRSNNNDEAQRNINVNVRQPAGTTRETTTTVPSTAQPSQVIVPSSQPPSQITLPPTTSSQPSTVTNVPSTEIVAPDKSIVSLEATVMSKNGSPQPVRGARFYLLKKDAESVLGEANIDNQTGQSSLLTALGMAVVYPDRYGDFNRKAMSAISKNAVYNATTDAGGKLQLKDIKPDNYYLFAITKSGNGFAVWSQPVTIQPGLNPLNLQPANPTEITQQPDLN